MSVKSKTDIQLGNTLIEVKSGVDAARNLRMGLIQLAYALIESGPSQKGILVLADPKVTFTRLEKEWHYAQGALRPDVLERLSLVIFKDGQFHGFPKDPEFEIRLKLEQVVRHQIKLEREHQHRGEAYYEILKILIRQWLLNHGPVTTDWLARTAGYSYPTVASSLKRLGKTIKRRTDRRIELAHFPRDEWSELVAVSERARSTIRFTDRSGQPRSPESLLKRLQKIERPNIAVGGVFGAKHYQPSLDLVGNPRLDLTIHNSTHSRTDLSFVDRLDPALRGEEDSRAPANLVIHFLRRHDSLFDGGPDGIKWADPVECLIDLHEARLEPQAREFLHFFTSRRSGE